MPQLTDMSLKKLVPPATGRITIWDGPLGVRVTANGVKTFITMIGSGRRHTIGRYPTISLAQARAAAQKLKAEKTLGRIFPELVGLEDAKEEYLKQADIRPNTRDYTVRNLNRLHASRLTDVTPRDITKIVDSLPPAAASQAIRVYSAFFNWCIRKHYLDKSPCARMQAAPSTPRARVLSDDELRSVWHATEDPTAFNTIVRLLMLTGQRRNEIASLQTSWVQQTVSTGTSRKAEKSDLWTITIPASVAKNGREHTFPLGLAARSVLPVTFETTELLFPARGSKRRPFNGWSKSKRALDQASGVKNWTLHDLRRTYASKMGALGVPIHVIERLLNHVSGTISGIVAVYQRHSFMPEMVEAVIKFETHISTLLARE